MQHPEIQIIVFMGDKHKRYPECDMLGAVAPSAALIITHLFVVSSRQRSENQEFNGRQRCEKSIIDRIHTITYCEYAEAFCSEEGSKRSGISWIIVKRKCRNQTWVHNCMSTNIDNIENIRL